MKCIKSFKIFTQNKFSSINESKSKIGKDIIECLEDSGLYEDCNSSIEMSKNKISLRGWICSEYGEGIRKRILSDHDLYSSLFIDGKLSSLDWEYKKDLPYSKFEEDEDDIEEYYDLKGMLKVEPELTKEYLDKIDLMIAEIENCVGIKTRLSDLILYKMTTTFRIYLDIL